MPNRGLCKIHATVSVIKCIIDPITTAKTTASKPIMLVKAQPISGTNLNSAIIGENRRKLPQQKRIHAATRNNPEVRILDWFKSQIICFLKMIPGLITLTTSWKPDFKAVSTHPEMRQRKYWLQFMLSFCSTSIQMLLSSPHGTFTFSGFHCLNEVVPLSSIFICCPMMVNSLLAEIVLQEIL